VPFAESEQNNLESDLGFLPKQKIMKQLVIAVNSLIVAASLTGCGKSPESTPPSTDGAGATPETKSTTEQVVDSVKEAAKPVVEEGKKAVEAAAQEVKAAADTVVADTTSKANELIAQAKKLISETKYSDASNILNQLSSMKLTPEQEKLVADLKTQLQKAMTALGGTNAASTINNLFK
jgi:NADH dehydrogenase/NADH:ubiquinone oxidoreductase subunit G